MRHGGFETRTLRGRSSTSSVRPPLRGHSSTGGAVRALEADRLARGPARPPAIARRVIGEGEPEPGTPILRCALGGLAVAREQLGGGRAIDTSTRKRRKHLDGQTSTGLETAGEALGAHPEHEFGRDEGGPEQGE